MAVPADDELQGLLDKFVCVRIVQMHGVDLNRFEFDGGLTWAIFFMNHDGTIYGRYGSRSGRGKVSEREISLGGFKKSLRGAMALHTRYAKDKEGVGKELAGKVAKTKSPWQKPELIPSLKQNARLNRPFMGEAGRHGGCIHCHMVPTNEVLSLRAAKKPIPDKKFWPYPMPDEVGFRMDPGEMATVQNVDEETAAAEAGFKKGDRILRLAGQPILSTADIQWVLHNAGDPAKLPVEVRRKGQLRQLELSLKKGWRRELGDWRFINIGLQNQLMGFSCRPTAGQRDELELKVQRVNQRRRPRLRLKQGDLIVSVDGKTEPMTLGAFTAYVFQKKRNGSRLKLTVLRRGRELKMQVLIGGNL